MSGPVGTLLYLSYGGEELHVLETRFAILSASRAVRNDPGIGILLLTDHPESYRDLPVEIEVLLPERLQEWRGTGGYPYRSKPLALAAALRRQQHPVVMLDSDTWFRRPARELFARIGPGASVMHLDEGGLCSRPNPTNRALGHQLAVGGYRDLAGTPYRLTEDERMWNSGVVGLHPRDAPLLDEAVHLIDQVWADHRAAHNLEQLAVSAVLTRNTRITPAHRVVFHYFAIRGPFRGQLVSLMSGASALPTERRADVLHRARPRLRGAARAKHAYKRLHRATGRPWRDHVPSNAS